MASSVAFPKILTLKSAGSEACAVEWLDSLVDSRPQPSAAAATAAAEGLPWQRFSPFWISAASPPLQACGCGCRSPASCEAGPSSWLRLPAGAAAPLDCCRRSNPFANNRLTATARKPIPMPGRRPTRWTLERGADESKQMRSDQTRCNAPTAYDAAWLRLLISRDATWSVKSSFHALLTACPILS